MCLAGTDGLWTDQRLGSVGNVQFNHAEEIADWFLLFPEENRRAFATLNFCWDHLPSLSFEKWHKKTVLLVHQPRSCEKVKSTCWRDHVSCFLTYFEFRFPFPPVSLFPSLPTRPKVQYLSLQYLLLGSLLFCIIVYALCRYKISQVKFIQVQLTFKSNFR